jgi:hypothetical protein
MVLTRVYSQKMTIIAYNTHWQTPAITEQHAFEKAQQLLPQVEGVAYFAFPWATFIDKHMHHPLDTIELRQKLYEFKAALSQYSKVITVCQHIFMLKYDYLFHDLGISDIFWTHAIKNQTVVPHYPHIRIHPFPLYPVQADRFNLEPWSHKKYLFSFIGAKPTQLYLSDARSLIFQYLSNAARGYVQARDKWHYGVQVYGQQIHGKPVSTEVHQTYLTQSQEFQTIMHQSIFALCPSGTGANTIRLWEAISMGVIPVVLSDLYQPPVDAALWNTAVLMCEENADAIKALPERLHALAQDTTQLEHKRQALKQLAQHYGKECFIYDIIELYKNYAQSSPPQQTPVAQSLSLPSNIETAHRLLSLMITPITVSHAKFFLMSVASYAFIDTLGLKQLFHNNPQLQHYITECLGYCNDEIYEKIYKIKQLKDLAR